jgi:hypothetical protein
MRLPSYFLLVLSGCVYSGKGVNFEFAFDLVSTVVGWIPLAGDFLQGDEGHDYCHLFLGPFSKRPRLLLLLPKRGFFLEEADCANRSLIFNRGCCKSRQPRQTCGSRSSAGRLVAIGGIHFICIPTFGTAESSYVCVRTSSCVALH